VLFTLEGGYDLQGLCNGCLAVLESLLAPDAEAASALAREEAAAIEHPQVEQARSVAMQYWSR